MIKKLYLYFKLTATTCFKNHIRMGLTIIGISIGLVVYMLGNAAINGYIEQLFKTADAFADNSYLITGYDTEIDWFEAKIKNTVNHHKSEFKALETYSVLPYYKYREHQIINTVHIIGTEKEALSFPIPYFSESGKIYNITGVLIAGRDFSKEDIENKKNVCLIEKSTAFLLFQSENAIGKKMHLESNKGYVDLEVIGIIEDNYHTQTRNFYFNKYTSEHNINKIRTESNVYIPISLVNEIAKDNSIDSQRIVILKNDVNSAESMDIAIEDAISESARLSKAVNVKSKQMLIEEIYETKKEFDIIKNLVSIFLFTVSGFSILTVFLFAIKERVYEIGVRRAVGASSFSILSQFIIEGILLSGIAAFISIATTIFISNYITFYIRDINYIDFTLILKKELIIGTLALSLLQGITFSFFPAVLASRINPTEAIRWD